MLQLDDKCYSDIFSWQKIMQPFWIVEFVKLAWMWPSSQIEYVCVVSHPKQNNRTKKQWKKHSVQNENTWQVISYWCIRDNVVFSFSTIFKYGIARAGKLLRRHSQNLWSVTVRVNVTSRLCNFQLLIFSSPFIFFGSIQYVVLF